MAVHSGVGWAAYTSERSSPRRRRKNQRGFALLLVFLMASIFAITLYMEVPRVAMQSERAKEALLIDRGEQYKRAIQLFTKKAGRYPGDIKDLESFQNQRFLRHRYIDPMTGKDEWRLIHIQAGILTDSKISAPPKQGEEKKDNGSFAGVENSFGPTNTGASQQGGAAIAQRRRAGDGNMAGMGPELPPVPPGSTSPIGPQGTQGLAGAPQPFPGQQFPQPGQPNQGQAMPVGAIAGQPGTNGPPTGMPGQPVFPGQQPGAFPGQPVYPGQQPGAYPPGYPGQQTGQQTGGLNGQPGFPGGRPIPGQQPPGGATNTAANSGSTGNSFGGGGNSFSSGSTTPTGMPVQPGQVVFQGQQPLPGQPGAPVNSQIGGVSPYPTTPGSNGTPPGINQPGGVATPQNQAASDMINRILTSPRPGGMPTGAQTGAGAALGGGIAGVASTAEGEGIMVYNDHTLYSEWEFVFDPAKQKQIPNPNAGGAVGTPAQQLGNTPGGIPGTPVQPGGILGTQPGGRGNSTGGSSTGGSSTGGSSGNSFGGGNSFSTPATPTPTPTRPGR